MSYLIKKMIINNKYNNYKEHSVRLLYLYNYRTKNINFLDIAWCPLSLVLQELIFSIYENNTINESYITKMIYNKYLELILDTKKSLYEKTFIKFLYDLNYIDESLLILLSSRKRYDNIKFGIVININNIYKLKDDIINKISKIISKNNKFYNILSLDIDKKISKIGYYIRELINIENKWWLITTGYKNIIKEEEEEEYKEIAWIFSECIIPNYNIDKD